MDNAARARQRLLAVFLPITAVLYISAEALDPKGTDQVINTTAVAFKVLPIAARHSAQLYVSGSLSILALGALAVSYAAMAMLVRGRGWVLATIAALLGGLGAAEAQSSKGPIVVLFMLPFAAAMVVLAARIWHAAALPASHSPGPAVVPL
jgi:hypothetical protein